MGTLNGFLKDKRKALAKVMEAVLADPQPLELKASANVRGRSGVRVIKVRQFELINDTQADYGGFDLGPNSPEHMMVALSGCLAHTTEMVAAMMELSIEKIDVDVSALVHALAQTPGYEHIPMGPYDIHYDLHIVSTESEKTLRELRRQVEASCPLYNFIMNPQVISGSLTASKPEAD